ncbi:DgyrCDS10557 [Dimorphilus gyrociliatus]|uniref:riboflavin kinase n=1 Tax=Dimorphilus gyrociliatus TaxID=2664684 RepID=A0A7I8W1R0_9ANNE|nr:DgyrCDS10557 [Dimorphilus gyrociliatus]
MSDNQNFQTVKLQGKVVRGFGRGSKEIGIPTANFEQSVVESLPTEFPCGIYFGWAKLNNEPVRKMVVSAGWNPHFKDLKTKAIETHILHSYNTDFYGSDLRIIITGYIREEKKFDSLDALIEEMQNDIRFAKEKLDLEEYKKYISDPFFNLVIPQLQPFCTSHIQIMFPDDNKPKDPLMADFDNRLSTFQDYDEESQPLKKEVLCKAGFFFIGPFDNVKCFFCGLAVKNWRSTDDPWHHHARLSPKCPHVLKMKGQEFVQKLRISKAKLSENTPTMVADEPFKVHPDLFRRLESEDSSEPKERPGKMLSSMELRMRMSQPFTREVTAMCEANSIPADFVRMALENRFHECGDDFENAEQFIKGIYKLLDARNGRGTAVFTIQSSVELDKENEESESCIRSNKS